MRWEGDLEGNENPAKITIDEEKEVIAVFEKNPHTLAVVIEGEGEVNQMILPTKETEYAYGSVIQLTAVPDRKSTRLNSSHVAISYAVFCLKKKQITTLRTH